jgi:hypothetical protein
MGKITIPTQMMAQLKSFASRGEIEEAVITAVIGTVKVAELSAAAEAAQAIVVTGTLYKLDGTPIKVATPIYVKTMAPTALKGYATVGTGTAIAGDGTNNVYLLTDASGVFTLSVANDQAEKTLVVVSLDNGLSELLELTFA